MSDVVVTCLAEAVRALEEARRDGCLVTLHSPPQAVRAMGPGYFREMIRQARQTVPGADSLAILDCGDAVGLALAALAAGVEAVRVAAAEPVMARIEDIALQSGGRVFRDWPEELERKAFGVTELP